jgi:hypothetical protein
MPRQPISDQIGDIRYPLVGGVQWVKVDHCSLGPGCSRVGVGWVDLGVGWSSPAIGKC